MSKTLAFGYGLCVLTLVAMLSATRLLPVHLYGSSVFFSVNVIGLLMLLGAVLCFRGAKASQGRIRKVLAYLVSAFCLFFGLGSAVAITLVASGSAIPG